MSSEPNTIDTGPVVPGIDPDLAPLHEAVAPGAHRAVQVGEQLAAIARGARTFVVAAGEG